MTKKVFLFIVEGLSDKDALEPILGELFDTSKAHFKVVRFDLTTNDDIYIKNLNMKQRIGEVIKSYLKDNRGITKKNIEKVIFLTDTDGCYINDNYIFFSQEDEKFRYEDDGIYSNRTNDVTYRNELKSRNLDIINSAHNISSLPFETYYFSCNLDHVLHHERNLLQSLKEEYATNFSDQYEGKEIEFVDFVNDIKIHLSKEYSESWLCIKKDNNSLLRYTNLNVFLKDNIDYMKTEVQDKIRTYF